MRGPCANAGQIAFAAINSVEQTVFFLSIHHQFTTEMLFRQDAGLCCVTTAATGAVRNKLAYRDPDQ